MDGEEERGSLKKWERAIIKCAALGEFARVPQVLSEK